MDNYVPYHIHDDTSNCNGFADSCTKYSDYIKLAKTQEMKAIAFSNHGGIYDWVKKKQACDKAGIKYIHGVELYLCNKLEDNHRGWHIGLYSKNWDGVKELNKLMSLATSKGKEEDKTDRHFYFNPRISINELFNTSNNIIITTACLASPLWKLSQPDDENYKENIKIRNDLLEWLSTNKHRCFLEVQYHNNKEQKTYNKMLLRWSNEYKIPLIAGTDTHSSSQYKAECRKVLQTAKNPNNYDMESEFDLTWKTYDELVLCFKEQMVLSDSEIMDAIENTNRLADMVEIFELDKSFKYPTLYGEDAKNQFENLVENKLIDKLKRGEIDNSKEEEYITKIEEEMKALSAQKMESFMMFMSELMTWCRENGINSSPCRGSVGGSEVAYILDITDVDPLVWNTVFSRFCNAERISLADIDQDFSPSDRPKVYEYIIKRFGNKNASYILTLGTVQDRGSIDVLAKGLGYENLEKVKEIKNIFDNSFNEYAKVVNECIGDLKELSEFEKLSSLAPNFDDYEIYKRRISNRSKIEILTKCKNQWDKLREDNKDLFYYFDGLKGTIVSKGIHAAGMIGSPITLDDNLGVFYKNGDNNLPVSFCSMKAVDALNFVKFDILGLKTIGIIQDALKLAGQNWKFAYQMNWNDKRVWENMVECNAGIFQFEGDYAHDLLKTMIGSMNHKNIATTINHMSMVNAALRPSGKSYRDKLVNGEMNSNPSNEIDVLLKDNNGFLIFQEDTIKFLTDICDFTGSAADTTRRAIGKKDEDLLKEQLPKILEGYCNHSPKSKEIAEQEAKQFVQIVQDSSDYQFGYNHSTGYSMVGYTSAYIRTYFTLEFVTSYLNWCENEIDYDNGMKMVAKYNINIKSPVFRYSKGKYFFDKETNSIYKGIGSIKFMNESIGDELYKFRDNTYISFIDLLKDIDKTSCNSRQLEILIKIGFFKEFGSIKKLLDITEVYVALKDSKKISKEKIMVLGLEGIDMTKYASDISNKTGKELKSWEMFDLDGLIKDVCEDISEDEFGFKQIIEWQNEHLGYIDYTDSQLDKRNAFVVSIDGKTTKKVHLYCLNNGKSSEFKINKKLFTNKPFEANDIVYTTSCSKKFKAIPLEKDENGKVTKWGKDTSVIEWWIDEYKVINNLIKRQVS